MGARQLTAKEEPDDSLRVYHSILLSARPLAEVAADHACGVGVGIVADSALGGRENRAAPRDGDAPTREKRHETRGPLFGQSPPRYHCGPSRFDAHGRAMPLAWQTVRKAE
jgi:hypothetical protein